MSNRSRQKVEEILQLFINNSDTFKVLAVKGKWGVGKTHLVKNFLEKQNKSYYYASVFGLSSIDELKSQILSNQGAVPKALKWLNDTSDKLPKSQETSTIALGGKILSSMMFNAIKNAIICIDDLERKSNLQLDEILGFIEYLVEELECQAIVIFNEEQLIKEEKSKQSIEEYREKVIDLEVELNPIVEENLFLASENNEYISFNPNDPDIETIKEILTIAQTKNIRILKRIRWNLDQFIPLMKDWNQTICSKIIRNIIITSLAKLDNTFPLDISKIIGYDHQKAHTALQSEKDMDDHLAMLGSVLKWRYTSLEVNREIISLIETGLFDKSFFEEKGQILSDKEDDSKVYERFQSILQLYYSSFSDNSLEIADRIHKFLQENCSYLNIDILRRINMFKQVLNLDISHYENQFFKDLIEKEKLHNLNELNLIIQKEFSHLPTELIELLEQRIKEYHASKDITTILLNMMGSHSLSREDQNFLNSQTVEEYCKWLKKGHPKLVSMVNEYLSFGNALSPNLPEAIKRLAQESPLNRMRAADLYNITIEDSPTELSE